MHHWLWRPAPFAKMIAKLIQRGGAAPLRGGGIRRGGTPRRLSEHAAQLNPFLLGEVGPVGAGLGGLLGRLGFTTTRVTRAP